jgi:hypothetical protein
MHLPSAAPFLMISRRRSAIKAIFAPCCRSRGNVFF